MFGNHFEHFLWLEMFEPRPSQIVVRPFPRVLPLRKDPILDRLLGTVGFVFFEGMQVIESLEEQQIGDLLHHFERV